MHELVGRGLKVKAEFNWHDIWIGAYVDCKKREFHSKYTPFHILKIYVCIIPMFPVLFQYKWGGQQVWSA